jgi:osmoprotectant transport system ATP-binding protein
VPIVELRGVSKRYGDRTVIDDLSLVIPEAETLVLLGTSGSGKTTALKMINRLVEPTEGTIRVFDEDVHGREPVELRRRIGYVIQDVGLFPHYTVRQNIAVVPELLRWPEERKHARVDELLTTVGLAELGARLPHELSGGQRQRVGLARALAADPPLVLLDEPFGALDPILRRQLQREFSNLKATLRKTMVLVTHDVAEAILLGDRICLLDAGRIQQLGQPRELLFEPKNDFVRAFFDVGRVQLELMATPVADVVEPTHATDRGSGARMISGSLPLAELLEDTTLLDDTAIVVERPERAVRTTRAQLLAASVRRRSVGAS